ncbi:MAG TPA: hypothetical protein VN903_01755 [Polyangia bacterium]|jgi:hypothetical protein|nr:hypothetical protein [Polyangia bacterium]
MTDVGVDCFGYAPVALEELGTLLEPRVRADREAALARRAARREERPTTNL